MWLSTGRSWRALDAFEVWPTFTPYALMHAAVDVTAMAIKFVEVEPDDWKPKPAATRRESPPAEAEGSAAELPGVSLPPPFAKPAPGGRAEGRRAGR